MFWLLTNRELQLNNRSFKSRKYLGYSIFFGSKSESSFKNNDYYDGAAAPYDKDDDLLKASIMKPAEFTHDFENKINIKNLKGHFVFLEFENTWFKIYSDYFGIRKYFYWLRGDEFIISNDLKAITEEVGAKPSAENMAVYALTYHFIGGLTAFQDIYYNKPGEVIEFKNGKLHFSQYWHAEELLSEKYKTDIKDIAAAFEQSVDAALEDNRSDRVSLSLTAGVDSRLLFSILLKKDVKLHTYTYGDPHSIDCVFAQKMCNDLGIPHRVHDIRFSGDGFRSLATRVIQEGQSLCSLHRAHRQQAVELESQYADVMFLGTMGGEFIKGANHDDYIISDFVFEFAQNQSMEILKKYLKKKRVRLERVDCDALFEFFRSQNWCLHPELVDFYGLVEIAAALHHAQNDMLYSHYFPKVLTPFLDLHYLRILFQSDFHFLAKKRYSSRFRQRLDNHRFAAELQYILNRKLAKYPYNSGFMVQEYRLNPLYAAIRSRIRKKLWNYAPNFPLGSWMREFVLSELEHLNKQNTVVRDVFEMDDLYKDLTTIDTHVTKESQWLKYTTPIQMLLSLEIFG